MSLPTGLTQDPDKARYYASDSFVRETLDQLTTLTPDPVVFAVRHALLLLKPDAVVTRSIGSVLGWLPDHGFRVVGAQRVQLGRATVRAMWHYQLNRATTARCLLIDAMARQGESLVLLLERDAGDLPATVALSSLKGPADPARRRPDQLRSRLGNFGFLLNLVHAADEPADLVRELGILLEGPARRALLTEGEPDVARLAAELYAGQAPHDLAFGPAAERLRALVPAARGLGDDPVEWRPVIEAVWSGELSLDGWDPIVVGHAAFPLSQGTEPQLLAGVDPDRWRSFAGAS